MNGLKAPADTQQQRKDLVFSQEVASVLQPLYLIPQCTSLQHKFSCAETFSKPLLLRTLILCQNLSTLLPHPHLLITGGFV